MKDPPVGGPDFFPETSWSLLRAAVGPAPRAAAAINDLLALYRTPVLLLVRRYGFDEADAEDLVQEYFVGLLDRKFLDRATPDLGRFRAFLRTDVKWFLRNAARKRSARRRGGGVAPVSLDRLKEEFAFEPSDPESSAIDDYFDRQCALEIVRAARAKVSQDYRDRGKEALFNRLQAGLTDPSGDRDYAEWASELGLSPGAVKVAMHRLRDRFRRAVEDLVRDSVLTEEDFHIEMAQLRRSLSQPG